MTPRRTNTLRYILALLLCAELAACGVTYTSPRIANQLGSVAVREVPLTAQTVLMANRMTPYRPRSLPQPFYEAASTGPAHSRLAALTDGPAGSAVSLEVVAYNSKHVAVGGLVATPVVVPLTVAPLTLGQAIAAAGGLTTRDRELGTIRIYRSGDLYQIPLRDYLARPDFRQLVLLNGDAVFADTSYDLDRALAFYRDQIDVINLNRQARGAALAELEQEVGLRRAELTESRDNFTVRSQLGAEQRDYVYLGGGSARTLVFPCPTVST